MMETLTAIRRAGVDIIVTYYARQAARTLQSREEAIKSRKLFEQARQILPGGVDSPVRAFQSVGGIPLFIRRASRHHRGRRRQPLHRLRDVLGPLIHGHAPSRLVKAIAEGGAARHELRAQSARAPARGTGARARAVDGTRALRQFRHRGGDERGAARAHSPAATRSSSSPAVITATRTASW